MTAVQLKPFIWPSDPAFISVDAKIKVEACINKAHSYVTKRLCRPVCRGAHLDARSS